MNEDSGTQFKMKLLILTLAAAYCAIDGCRATEVCFGDAKKYTDVTKAPVRSLYKHQIAFSLRLLKIINSFENDKNIFFSPHSIFNALLESYFLSKKVTLKKLKEALFIRPEVEKSQIYASYKYLKNVKQSPNSGVLFKSANKIFYEKSLQVRQCMKDLFMDELEPVDFRKNSSGAVQRINNWVYEYTDKMIENLLADDSIDERTNAALVNAAYFKGSWRKVFDKNLTKPGVFHESAEKRYFTEMMSQISYRNFSVSENLDSFILELPYKDETNSMFIILPFKSSISTVLQKLTTDMLDRILSGEDMMSTEVDLKLPKLRFERRINLVHVLEAIGIGDLFSTTVDLSELTGKKEIFFGDAIHKARIEVDEEGSKAAAATAVVGFRSGRTDPIVFECNKPFIFLIYDRNAQTILFSGVMRSAKPFSSD